MARLKLPYFGQIIQRPNSLVKTVMWGKIEEKRVTNSQTDGLSYSVFDCIIGRPEKPD